MMRETIVERLKRESQEKQQQRQAQLQTYEQELAARREQRKKDRNLRQIAEQKAQSLSTGFVTQSVSSTVKKAEIKTVVADLLNHDIKVKQKSVHARINEDRVLFNERRKKLEQIRKQITACRAPPRQRYLMVHQPTEFYGVDFKQDPVVERQQQELFHLNQQRENELIQDPSKVDKILRTGDTFIKAMMDARSVEAVIKFGLPQFPDNKNDDEVEDQQPKGHNILLKSLRRMSSVQADPHFHVTDNSNSDSSAKEVAPSEIIKKRWIDTLPKATIDYSEMFPIDVGSQVGLKVFCIQDMRPILQVYSSSDENRMGTFCDGESYIILKTFITEEAQNPGKLDWQIYQWLGAEATIDKHACSAIYAVGLRNLLGSKREIIRIESQDPTQEFINEFYQLGLDYEIVDASYATASGLYTVMPRTYPFLVFQVSCHNVQLTRKRFETRLDDVGGDLEQYYNKFVQLKEESSVIPGQFDLELVSPNMHEFKDQCVYFIDNGLELFQWNGRDSNLSERTRCRLFIQNVINSERGSSKATFTECFQGQECEALMDCFASHSNGSLIQQSLDTTRENEAKLRYLYVFTEENVVQVAQIKPIENYLVHPSLNSASELTRSPLPSMDNNLSETSCCVLDCRNEIYLWTGTKSSNTLRQVTQLILMQKIIPLQKRPPFMHSSKVMQTVEPEIFKIRFRDWKSAGTAETDYRESKPTFSRPSERRQLKSDEPQKIDLSALLSPPHSGKYSDSELQMYQTLFERANMLLQNFQAYIFDTNSKQFLKLDQFATIDKRDDDREKGHFWSSEFYVFVCLYKRQTDDHNSSESPSAAVNNSETNLSSGKPSYECVTYTWSGRHSENPSFGHLVYEFEFKQQIKGLIANLSQGEVQTNTVHLSQEKESLAFLAHLNCRMVIHLGQRSQELARTTIKYEEVAEIARSKPDVTLNGNTEYKKVHSNDCKLFPPAEVYPLASRQDEFRMFHVRTDPKLGVVRGIEVPPIVQSLCTRDCFVLISLTTDRPSENYLWTGRGTNMQECKKAEEIADSLIRYYHKGASYDRNMVRVKEKSEIPRFWSILTGGGGEKFLGQICTGQGFYQALPAPRLFCCTANEGIFQVQDLGSTFSVSDLQRDNVYILDSGPTRGRPYLIWVWIGKSAREVLISFSKKSLQLYLEHDNNNRNERTWNEEDWEQALKQQFAQPRIETLMQEENRLKPKKAVIPSSNGNIQISGSQPIVNKSREILDRPESDVKIVKQGQEPPEFRAFFHGFV